MHVLCNHDADRGSQGKKQHTLNGCTYIVFIFCLFVFLFLAHLVQGLFSESELIRCHLKETQGFGFRKPVQYDAESAAEVTYTETNLQVCSK